MSFSAKWVQFVFLMVLAFAGTDLRAEPPSHNPLHWPRGQGVCSGKWEYKKFKVCTHATRYREKASLACGEPEYLTVTNYKSCRTKENGIETVVDKFYRERLTDNRPWLPDNELVDACTNDHLNPSKLAERNWILTGPVTISGRDRDPRSRITKIIGGVVHFDCIAPVRETIYLDRRHPACGIESTTIDKGIVVAWRTCRDASHGIESVEETGRFSDCGVEPILYQSEAESHVKDVRAIAGVHDVSCSTCDELPVDTIDEVALKYKCLNLRIEAWESGAASLNQKELAMLVRTLNALLFMKGHELRIEQVEHIHELSQRYHY